MQKCNNIDGPIDVTTGHIASLRERKRQRTRQALIDAAADLFERKGYSETTVAEIAMAADVSPRTFFSYFVSKEELLFPDTAARVGAVLSAIDARQPDDAPLDVLLRALQQAIEVDFDVLSPMARLRLRLVSSNASIRGRIVLIQQAAQREIAERLVAAFPKSLDRLGAAALAGAFVGAISGALFAMLEDLASGVTTPSDFPTLRENVRMAAETALMSPSRRKRAQGKSR